MRIGCLFVDVLRRGEIVPSFYFRGHVRYVTVVAEIWEWAETRLLVEDNNVR